MTRPINMDGREREWKVAEALQGKESGKYKSYAEAAHSLGVPPSTVYACAKGCPTHTQAHEPKQLLSGEEEKELVRWICQLTDSGYPPKPYAVREMAEAIQIRRLIGINDASVRHVSYDAIGEQWVKRFMSHHPELKSVIAEQIEAVRIQETSCPVIEKWFDDVESIINEYNIQTTPRHLQHG